LDELVKMEKKVKKHHIFMVLTAWNVYMMRKSYMVLI